MISASAFILIGGNSKRFGTTKWQAMINGKTVLERMWKSCDKFQERYLIGKDVLWKTLKEFLNMPKELENNQTSTKEFVSLLNENSESDLAWVFEQYMEKKELPTLLIKEKINKEKRFIDLWWEEDGFRMPIEISYMAIEGSRMKKVDLNNEPRRFVVPDSTGYVLDPNGWVLFNKKNIKGDTVESTE